ncbi:hypothetical protein ACDI16_23085, partial [Oceanobacillus caeni]
MSSSYNGKKQERSSTYFRQKDYCKSCGSHVPDCKCQMKIMKPVKCSKELQIVGEIDIPLSFLDVYIVNGILTPPLNVIIDESGISQNFVVLKDKVVNIGVVP